MAAEAIARFAGGDAAAAVSVPGPEQLRFGAGRAGGCDGARSHNYGSV